jgi:DNA polymerase elongation subunit (family B)
LKILHLDIEISPSLATVWGLFNQNININALQGNSEVLTWAAMWHGEEDILYSGLHFATKRQMIQAVYDLLNEADVVVTYNGDRFDLKILNKEFLELGMTPPAPYKSIDLYKVVKRNFRFTSNKMDYVAKQLGIEGKTDHRGYQMWLDCMDGDVAAFEEMSEYNRQDVVILENLFNRLQGWIKGLNYSVFTGELVCPECGGSHYQKRGPAILKTGIYQRFQCQNKLCGHWFRSQKNEAAKEKFISL